MTYHHTRSPPTKVLARYLLAASRVNLTDDLETHFRGGRIEFQTYRSRPERFELYDTKQRNLRRCQSCLEPKNHSVVDYFGATSQVLRDTMSPPQWSSGPFPLNYLRSWLYSSLPVDYGGFEAQSLWN